MNWKLQTLKEMKNVREISHNKKRLKLITKINYLFNKLNEKVFVIKF